MLLKTSLWNGLTTGTSGGRYEGLGRSIVTGLRKVIVLRNCAPTVEHGGNIDVASRKDAGTKSDK